MILLVGFGLPFALYVAWALASTRSGGRGRRLLARLRIDSERLGAHAAAAAAALVCCVVVAFAVGKGSTLSKSIAWSGVECPDSTCRELRIGGDPSVRTLGWPNGSFAPEIDFQLRDDNVALRMQGGGGFVLRNREPLNGNAVDPLRGGSFDVYTLVPEGCGGTVGRLLTPLRNLPVASRRCAPLLTFRDAAGAAALVNIPRPTENRSRPVRLSDLVIRKKKPGWIAALLGNPAPVPVPTPGFMEWASSILVYRNGTSPTVHLLDGSPFDATVSAGDSVTIAWSGTNSETLRFTREPSFRIDFGRPYHRSAPVANASATAHDFIVTTAPEPGDYAFILPLGQSESDPRFPIRMTDEKPATDARTLPPYVLDREVISVTRGDLTLDLRQDAFGVGAIRWLLVPMAFLTFIAAVFVVARLSTDALRRARLTGLLLGTWMLLMLRLLLAVRYALPPAPLDWLAVKGLLFSAWPLMLLPPVLASLVVGQFEATHGRMRNARAMSLLLAAAVAAGAVAVWVAPSWIWNPLPERVAGEVHRYGVALAVLSALVAVWTLRTRLRVGSRQLPLDLGAPMRRWQARFSLPSATPPARGTLAAFPRSQRSILKMFGWTLLAVIVVAAFVRADLEVLVRDIGIHGVWLWFPAILWLGSLAAFETQRAMLGPIMLTVVIAVFVTPFVAGDPGSIVSAVSVFAALALILLHYPRSRPAAAAIVILLVFGIAVGLVAYVNVEGLFSTVHWAGNAPKYVLVYKHGAASTSDILGRSANLAGAYQHNWENQAMVARGGVAGAGYGEAPARRSWVRQDTLQYDSVYAFFIAGDHGILGGAALLIIYIGLLVLAAMGRHARSAFGAIPQLVFLAMGLEAMVHTSMNVGLLPFAGRDLPMLAVISVTDVLKWSLLIAIAFTGDLADNASPASGIRRPAFRSIYAFAALVAVCCLGVQISRVVSNRYERFTWQPLLDEARDYIQRGEIHLDDSGDVVFAGRAAKFPDESLLSLERDRFNLTTQQQRFGGSVANNLTDALYRVSNRADFNRVLASAVVNSGGFAGSRPLLFRFREAKRYADLGGLLRITAPGGGAVLDVNPAYNTQLSFERDAATDEFPKLYYRDRGLQWELRGRGFTIAIPARGRRPFETRSVTLRRTRRGDLRVIEDSNPGGADVTINVDVDRQGRIAVLGGPYFTRKPILELKYEGDKPVIANVRQGATWEIQHSDGKTVTVQPVNDPFRGRTALTEGDVVRPAAADFARVLQMHVVAREAGAIVGPAHVMGRQVAVVGPESNLPWLGIFASVAGSEARALGAYIRGKSEEVTLDRALQQRVQSFVWDKGLDLHQARLTSVGGYRNALLRTKQYRAHPDRIRIAFVSERVLPPRVGMTILSIPDGGVLAMGSWPRPDFAQVSSRPSYELLNALDRTAPGYVKARFLGDRNFDRIEVGSATKPIIAAAALTLQQHLDRQLCVKWNGSGAPAPEDNVFGIKIAGKPWMLGHADYIGRPVDFDNYLEQSSNLYEIRLGFLALAKRDQNGDAVGMAGSPSDEEAMGGCTPWNPWRQYPNFPDGLGFSQTSPKTLNALYDTDFAAQLHKLYTVGVRWQDARQVRESFWSAVADDDFRAPAQSDPKLRERSDVPGIFAAISPETTNLELDDVDTPRELVSFLLGGSTNRWSNTDLAAAFATAVTGNSVHPHMLNLDPKLSSSFTPVPAVSARLRPGLQRVWTQGTANALSAIGRQFESQGIAVYMKTGTAEVEARDPFDAPPTSRLVVALIRWADQASGRVDKGLILSLYSERGGMGTATRWMSDFLSDPNNRAHLLRLLAPRGATP